MDLTSMNDESFNLSDDFFDALSVIATTNPNFAVTQQQQQQQQQQPNPQITTQYLIEEQQQCALQFAPQQPQSSPQLQQQQQLNFQQQQQQRLIHQQQLMQQVGYQQQQQQCQRPVAPQQSMIQQQQRILAACQQQQQQQQYRSPAPTQSQPLQAPRNFVQQQVDTQQQPTAQQRLFLQQQQYQRPVAQLQNEQSHALQLASQLQYHQQSQGKQLPTVSRVQNQQPQTRQSVSPLQYQQTQVPNQPSQAIQIASQLQMQQSARIPFNQSQAQIQNLKPTIQSQQIPVQQTVSRLQQQPNVGVPAPQIQVQQQLPNKQPAQAQQPIQLTVSQQRLIAAHQQQQQPPNLAREHRQPVAPQNTFPTVSQQQNVQTATTTTTTTATTTTKRVKPHLEIVEQPAPRATRFRYNCEVRDSGSIPGVNSTPTTKTYPSIRIVGYKGNAVVIVSCVTKDPPYRPHPHNLVGRQWCQNGICKTPLTSNCMSVTFDRLGIQCIKRKDFLASLEQREEQKVDPFGTGFEHKEKDKLATIDQNCVRLAFQAFIEGPKKGEFKIQLQPVVSDPIHDKKNSPDLTIYKMSHCSSPAGGDLEMILLCDRVVKEDIQVRFYEERDEEVAWEKFVDVKRTGAVHKYVAIVFRSPKYRETDFFDTIHAKVELVRPSDGMYSNSLPFDFTPENEPIVMQKKRKRLHESLVARDLEAASTYSDQWSAMSHSNFNIIEAR